MGFLYELNCPKCEYHQKIRVGCGRDDFKQDRILGYFDMMEAWDIKTDAIVKNAKYLIFRYCLGRCKDCGKLLEVPEVRFEDGELFYGKTCDCNPKKEHEMEIYEIDNTPEIPCPRCNGRIQMRRIGLWD